MDMTHSKHRDRTNPRSAVVVSHCDGMRHEYPNLKRENARVRVIRNVPTAIQPAPKFKSGGCTLGGLHQVDVPEMKDSLEAKTIMGKRQVD